MSQPLFTLAEIRHPDFIFDSTQWTFWRDTFEGGELYLDRYLNKFSTRETEVDYAIRKANTPIPTFAKAAILDIRNSIFQRLADVSRIGGTLSFQRAASGEDVGVDRKGSSMNSFIGIDVLTELLIMGRVGVYLDAPNALPTTMADLSPELVTPYLYCYRVEDILSFVEEAQEEPGQFKAVLLRDHIIEHSTEMHEMPIALPMGRKKRLRLVWKDDVDGIVRAKMWDEETGELIFMDGAGPDGIIELGVPFVPFIMPSIGDSLLKDAAWYQRALLNLVSSDVSYALKSNHPFLTIQQDLRTVGSHLKKPGIADEATPGSQPASDNIEQFGAGAGRYYDLETDRPGYISPPTDPLVTSMKLQEKLEDDIRKLINLAVANKTGSRTESAEAKKISAQGLEAGLSFIGTVLRETEQRIAHMWALYENIRNPLVAKIGYPSRYILKEDSERIEEANSLIKVMDQLPTKQGKKAAAKQIINILLAGKESTSTIQKIHTEIDRAGFTTSDVQSILQAHKVSLVSDATASEALGFNPDKELEQARKDHVERATAILAAQTSPSGIQNPASRGVPELDPNPNSGSEEQAEGQQRRREERALEQEEEE